MRRFAVRPQKSTSSVAYCDPSPLDAYSSSHWAVNGVEGGGAQFGTYDTCTFDLLGSFEGYSDVSAIKDNDGESTGYHPREVSPSWRQINGSTRAYWRIAPAQ